MTILITGSNGGIGSELIEYLLSKTQHTIIAGIRSPSSKKNLEEFEKFDPRFQIWKFDLNDEGNIRKVIKDTYPDYLIHLGGISEVVGQSSPQSYINTNVASLIFILESIKEFNSKCKVFVAGSSEIFGKAKSVYSDLDERSPESLYGLTKKWCEDICNIYRKDLFITYGILFNCASKYSSQNFVISKIAKGIKKAIQNKNSPLKIGNIKAQRDFSHARDFVEGIWAALNNKAGSDSFVFSSGKLHSIENIIDFYLNHANIQGEWKDDFYVSKNRILIEIDEKLKRANDIGICGDYTKATKILGWRPQRTFDELLMDLI